MSQQPKLPTELREQVRTSLQPAHAAMAEHFLWSQDGLLVLPQTPVARATVALLELNRERILKIRRADVEVGRHPPEGD